MRGLEMVHVDGSRGEGGGQIVRTSLSLAAVLGRAVAIHQLRAKRRRPGLQPQHLAAVLAAAKICGADVSGADVGSSELVFIPRHEPRGGGYRFDIGTAGAASLVVQTVLVPLALAAEPSELVGVGGTHLPFSPPVDYLVDVYAPSLAEGDWQVDVDYERAGYYPRGGGEVRALVAPSSPTGFHLMARGAIHAVEVRVIVSNLPGLVGERGVRAAAETLAGVEDLRVTSTTVPAYSPGAAVIVRVAHEGGVAGFSSIGERGKPIDEVAREACQRALVWLESDACCDQHLADQLVLPACLSGARSLWTTDVVTEHTQTVLELASQFLPVSFDIERGPGEAWTVGVDARWQGPSSPLSARGNRLS